MNFMQHIESISPAKATVISSITIGANLIAWIDKTKHFVEQVAPILTFVTTVLVIIYWAIKIYNEYRAAKQKPHLTKRRCRKSSKQ